MYAYVHFEGVLHILHMHCCAEALYSAYGFSESAIMAARQIGFALPCTTNMHRTETPVLFVQVMLFIFLGASAFYKSPAKTELVRHFRPHDTRFGPMPLRRSL